MNTSLLRQVAQTFLAEYEEQEGADWSPEWRALAELARAALAPCPDVAMPELPQAGVATRYGTPCYTADQMRAYALAALSTPTAPAVEAQAVAWAQFRTIDDDDGRPIGTDEPRVVWGTEHPDPDESWFPLYEEKAPVVVYQATSRTLQSAYFGEWSAARAWAGEHGSVTMHTIPPARPELRSVDEFAVIDEGAWNRLKPTHPPPASGGVVSERLIAAGNRLAQAAMITGGVAGPDTNLQEATAEWCAALAAQGDEGRGRG